MHVHEEVVVVPLDVAVAEVFEEALQRCFQFVGPVPAKGGAVSEALFEKWIWASKDSKGV